MRDRRNHKRNLIDTEIRLYHDNFGMLEGCIRDISDGGVCVALHDPTTADHCSKTGVMLMRPVNIDFLYTVKFVRSTEECVMFRFIDDEMD